MSGQSKRKSISKKLRFNIFKRDCFTCQYCGGTPPSSVLEIDHIDPVANGGTNDEENLITACFSCNRGKGKELLSSIPETLEEKAKILAEKELQIKGYRKIVDKRNKRIEADLDALDDMMIEGANRQFTDEFRLSIKNNFLPKLDIYEIENALDIALSKFSDTPERVTSYFCGICWTKIRNNEESA